MGKQFGCPFTSGTRGGSNLKEGDQIEITIAGKRKFQVARNSSRAKALRRLRNSKWTLPPGFKFDRNEARER